MGCARGRKLQRRVPIALLDVDFDIFLALVKTLLSGQLRFCSKALRLNRKEITQFKQAWK